MVSDKLKEIIFKKLYRDLRDVEIIPYEDSIYFINRENRYWYLELEKNGTLYWRYTFFQQFFELFSLDHPVYVDIISEWVEEVLNYKVTSTEEPRWNSEVQADMILNHKVSSIGDVVSCIKKEAEEVLKHTMSLALKSGCEGSQVEEVLNYKVLSTNAMGAWHPVPEELVLNNKVLSSLPLTASTPGNMDEILNGGNV